MTTATARSPGPQVGLAGPFPNPGLVATTFQPHSLLCCDIPRSCGAQGRWSLPLMIQLRPHWGFPQQSQPHSLLRCDIPRPWGTQGRWSLRSQLQSHRSSSSPTPGPVWGCLKDTWSPLPRLERLIPALCCSPPGDLCSRRVFMAVWAHRESSGCQIGTGSKIPSGTASPGRTREPHAR